MALDRGASSCHRVGDGTGVRISTPTSRSTRKRNEGRLAHPTAYLDTVTDTDHLVMIQLRQFVTLPLDVLNSSSD